MDEMLKQIHIYAQQLKSINMWQAAGDYDYITSFLNSPNLHGGQYFGVVPRGEETIDAYSHDCPIPYTANIQLSAKCTDNERALDILNGLLDIFNTLKSEVTGDGLVAVNSYITNTNLYIELLGGQPVPPGPPTPPEPEGTNSYVASDKSEITLVPNVYYVLYDSSASEFEYDYKQITEVVGVYNSEDKPVERDIQIKSLHDGTSWKLYAFTTQENVTINRVKFNTEREAIDYIILGGLMTSTVDKPWIIREVFSNMYTDQ